MASLSSTKSDDMTLIPILGKEEAKSPTKPDNEITISELIDEVAKLRRNTEDSQLSKPKAKIQKVQPYLRERQDFARYYYPKLVSIGPIHRERGKNYKLMWAAMYLEANGKVAEELLRKIHLNLDELKECYSHDVIKEVDDNKLAEIFLSDGCAVLFFMAKASAGNPEELKIKVDQLVIVQHDLLLSENQLPYQLLKLLCDDDEANLKCYINNFIKMHHMMQQDSGKPVESKKATEGRSKEAVIIVDHPIHLLDVLRTAILKGRTSERGQKSVQDWPTYRNIQELKSAGIEVIKNEEQSRLTDISFTCRFFLAGRLHLSRLIVDDSTAATFLNLIAYEMCPDFKNHYEISSYIAFLDSLIDHPDDVKVLRKARVLHNALGSDEEVTRLFNTIATDLVPNVDTYATVRKQLEDHYSKPIITRMAELYTNHFNSPWSIVGFLAAFIALFLTCVQTWFTLPRDEPPPPCMKICKFP